MSDQRLAEIAAVQDRIMKALKDTPKTSGEAADAALAKEREEMDAKARQIGVSPEDYRQWCAGADLPHVRSAIIKSQR